MENKPLLRQNAGFTLLETIIAMTIMVLALASILSVESSGIAAAEKTRLMNNVSMLARNKMIETEFKIQGKTFEEVRKEETGAFDEPFKEFNWKVVIKEIKFPNLISGQSGSSAGAAGGGDTSAPGGGDLTEMLGKLVTKFLSKALREITVSVSWTRDGRDSSFSVSTYWVDLNHEFELTP